MKISLLSLFFFFLSLTGWTTEYKVLPGTLHKKGKIFVKVLPDTEKYQVKMDYEVRKKEFVPVPSSLLEGTKTMQFPNAFRTEEGYRELAQKKSMKVPKAELRFVKRADVGKYKDAYFLEVHPTNKKSKIDIIYHPDIPATGWLEVDITFLSKFPLLDGYELEARLRR